MKSDISDFLYWYFTNRNKEVQHFKVASLLPITKAGLTKFALSGIGIPKLSSITSAAKVVTLSPLSIRKRSPNKLTIFWPNCCRESTWSAADIERINKPTPDTDKTVAIPSARTPRANPLRMFSIYGDKGDKNDKSSLPAKIKQMIFDIQNIVSCPT
uniref:Uncharacterized protein n=1 Tax=Elaeophora elaphi TaxID=1147741 RepID=A0A0R3RPX6_9BILA